MTDFRQMKDCISGRTPQLKAEADAIVDRMESEEKQWIRELREQGFKASHPNDGWVDRENKTFILQYPQFDDGVGLLDKVMLGWPFHKDENVPVRVIAIEDRTFGSTRYRYEHLKVVKPKKKKRSLRSWLKKIL